jgi:hypoxia up-regulated 1
VAMQFAYVKDLAESLAGERVYDVIVTVPPFYSQFERDAVADAIEISGLRTLALINDGTAVAINFAMTRSFPKPEYHVVYDAGASSIRATAVSFAERSGKGAGTMISVLGVGYDRSTGGIELDRRLQEILIENFNSKHKRDIRQDKKGMARLWKEAGRLKAILSANSDGTSTVSVARIDLISTRHRCDKQVESLAWDIDFRSKLTRASFEDACDDLKERFAQPIFNALDNAGLTLVISLLDHAKMLSCHSSHRTISLR